MPLLFLAPSWHPHINQPLFFAGVLLVFIHCSCIFSLHVALCACVQFVMIMTMAKFYSSMMYNTDNTDNDAIYNTDIK